MRLKILLEHSKIRDFMKYSSSYLELCFIENGLYLVSSSSDMSVIQEVIISQLEGNLVSLRFPDYLLKNLKDETMLDIVTSGRDVSFTFINQKGEPSYTLELANQVSVIDTSIMYKYLKNLTEYEKYSMSKHIELIRSLSKMNTDIICLDEKLYGIYYRSYLFKKAKLPNFMVNSTLLYKSLDISTDVVFAGKYIIVQNNYLTVFVNKLRVPLYCDLDYVSKFRSHMKFSFNGNALNNLVSKLGFSREGNYILDLDKKTLSVDENSKRLSVMLKIDIDDYFDSSKIDVEALMKNLSSSSVNMEDFEKPKLNIPSWILAYNLFSGNVECQLSDNFIVAKLEKFKILFPRGEVKYEKRPNEIED